MESAEIVKSLENIISKDLIKTNEPMKNHTSFKIGGPAEIYIKITSIEELQKVLELSLIHISEPTRPQQLSRMPSSA